jgi:hypothetical protein
MVNRLWQGGHRPCWPTPSSAPDSIVYFLPLQSIDINSVRLSYNLYFSAYFFSRNSVFLSQQISEQYFQPWLFSETNGLIYAKSISSVTFVLSGYLYALHQTDTYIEVHMHAIFFE